VNEGTVIAPAIDSQVSASGTLPGRVSVAEGYARWAASYDRTPNPLLALEERCLLPLLPNVAGKRVLDLACGTGRWLEKWLAAGPALGIGIDFSPAMLSVAREKTAIPGRLARADCLKLPLRNASFDLAICSFALEHIGKLNELSGECWRVLGEPADFYVSELHPAAYDAGWRTGFRDQLGALQIESTSHSSKEIVSAFNSVGFELAHALECFVGEPERPLFAKAGKEGYFDKARVVPAVMIWHFRRTAREQGLARKGRR
jgi:ubiquinone/menaquinone biosynthesis C-methylase UbiE